MADLRFSLVIPAYNEEDRILDVLISIKENLPELFELIVVFDGNDKTPEIVNVNYPSAKVLVYNQRLGKGRAILEGFKNSNGDIVGYVDADGSIKGDEIKRLRDMISENTAIISSRYRKDSMVDKRQKLLRRLLSRGFNILTRFILKIDVNDTQCGLKIFMKKNIDQVINKVKVNDWAFDISLLFHLKKSGCKITEVGIRWSDKSKSKLKVTNVVPEMLLSIFGIWFFNFLESHEKLEKIRTKFNEIYLKGDN
ncbi:glycosyltransferase [Caldiplasma sukawensis]